MASVQPRSSHLARHAAEVVDAAAGNRVIVFGNPPPDGRDLDLLVRPAEEEDIATGLAEAGFRRYGSQWAIFRDSSAHAVYLLPVDRFGLASDLLETVYDQARPVEGWRMLATLAPHHELLVIARLGVTAKKAERIRELLAEDPEAWARAQAEARAWGARLRKRPRRLHRPRPPRRAVVSLSGLDGAGKSSQGRALAESLTQLGHQAVAVWLPLASNPSVGQISTVSRHLLRRLRWLPGVRRLDARARAGASFFAAPGANRRPGLLANAWVTYVAVANALTHRRLSRRAHIVVFDRYVTDSIVRMRYLWGGDFRFQRFLLRALSPRPAASFLLDVRPETALSRKQDQWSLNDLRRQADLYREEATTLGVVRLDGQLAPDVLAAEIAETVWRTLQ